jgi:2,3-dihydroxybenzoate-AMP ligase
MDFLCAYCARAGKGTRVQLWIFCVHIVREPEKNLGEKTCAFVVPTDGVAPDRDELRAFLLGRGLAEYKVPDRVEQIVALPRTPIGKIDKNALRDRLPHAAADGEARP